jgi:hypothetical protein
MNTLPTDWKCIRCESWNYDVRRRCRICGSEPRGRETRRGIVAELRTLPPIQTDVPLSNIRFAQRAAVISSKASRWARDILDEPTENAGADTVKRFCDEIGECIKDLKTFATTRIDNG